MANGKHRGTKSEKDPLNEPIVQPDWLVVALFAGHYRADPAVKQAVVDEAIGWVNRQRAQKLLLLLKRYGLSSDDPERWLLLSLRLAEEYIEGFRVVERTPQKRGRPSGTTRKIDAFELFKAVQEICYEKGCGVSKACRELVGTRKKPWRGLTPESLETRYYEQKAKFRALTSNKGKGALLSHLEAVAARAKKSP